jgi:nitroimidazol reductase NimA-like FMN-containing flavoprotein (pyridoxamine 5'-phosphate oxidase superfamily)
MTRLSRTECVARLGAARIGRVAVNARAMPAVVPVNYMMSEDSIVFRTKANGLLARACNDSVVAFEIDRLSDDGGHGWSVMVIGVATLLTGRAAARAQRLDLASAMGEGRDQFVSITLGQVSGRRVGAAAQPDLTPDVPSSEGPTTLPSLRQDVARWH